MPRPTVRCFHVLFLSLTLLSLIPLALHAQTVTAPPPKYARAIARLDAWIAAEVRAKDIPSLALALVDDQKIVWAKGFGWADADKKQAASADTLYRVGSVSKPITALVLMMLVELGLLDLDAPVQKYLPEFQPRNPFPEKITLRHLLSHRSGLVREPPVGNYFDDSQPTLAQTVASLNQTELVYRPGSKTSYSNAGLGVVGRVMEKVLHKDFNAIMTEKLLQPLGLRHSGYALTPEQRQQLAQAMMWTYHGREFPAPTFDFGMAPAGNLCASANDMARLLQFLLARGQGPKGPLLKAETLEKMWQPQFLKKDEKAGFGLGFHVSDLHGKRKISHGGAVYGFATEFVALPDDKLGIIVMASKDVANGVTRHVGEAALLSLLAVRQGKPLPPLQVTKSVGKDFARKRAGRYVTGKKVVELEEKDGKLYHWPLWQGVRLEIRRGPRGLIVDDLLGGGAPVQIDGDTITLQDDTFKKVDPPEPQPLPEKWRGLIGEYGWDYNTLYILEKDNQLYALIEWAFLYPLEEISANEFRFPDFGLYHGHKLLFTRDRMGQAVKVEASTVTFPRRRLKGENHTFTIVPRQPIPKLRQQALAATPPVEKSDFRQPDLVDITTLDGSIKLDIRYAGNDNFLQTPVYTSARAYLQRPAAEALARVSKKLADKGYGLLVYDGYRPWHVTKIFWDAAPEKYKHFVANPQHGSRHNRGCAIDLSLYDLKTGQPVSMVSGYDEFSDRAYVAYLGGTSEQRCHREILHRAMEEEGFTVYEAEWWHYDYRDWRQYPILNVTFEELQRRKN